VPYIICLTVRQYTINMVLSPPIHRIKNNHAAICAGMATSLVGIADTYSVGVGKYQISMIKSARASLGHRVIGSSSRWVDNIAECMEHSEQKRSWSRMIGEAHR
jgi:hypothetical protein